MALTKMQVLKAARLYGLAMAAHADSGGSETDDETRVMWASQERAESALARLGYDKSQLVTIQDCIRAARNA
jgi:hypothetical protein